MSDLELFIGAVAVAAIVTLVWVRLRQARTRVDDDTAEPESGVEVRPPAEPQASAPVFPPPAEVPAPAPLPEPQPARAVEPPMPSAGPVELRSTDRPNPPLPDAARAAELDAPGSVGPAHTPAPPVGMAPAIEPPAA